MADISTTDITSFLEALNEDAELPVEKILVRQVNPVLYACQVWRQGDVDPEAFFLQLTEAPPSDER